VADGMALFSTLDTFERPSDHHGFSCWFAVAGGLQVDYTVVVLGEDHAVEYDCGGDGVAGLLTNYCIRM
jgi:hypothetical protein